MCVFNCMFQDILHLGVKGCINSETPPQLKPASLGRQLKLALHSSAPNVVFKESNQTNGRSSLQFHILQRYTCLSASKQNNSAVLLPAAPRTRGGEASGCSALIDCGSVSRTRSHLGTQCFVSVRGFTTTLGNLRLVIQRDLRKTGGQMADVQVEKKERSVVTERAALRHNNVKHSKQPPEQRARLRGCLDVLRFCTFNEF